VVFSPHEMRRYVGFGWPGSTHKEQPEQPNPLARRASRSFNLRLGGRGGRPVPRSQQSPGGWRYHPARRSRTGTDEMRNHRIR
jgi:hypothetical protein